MHSTRTCFYDASRPIWFRPGGYSLWVQRSRPAYWAVITGSTVLAIERRGHFRFRRKMMLPHDAALRPPRGRMNRTVRGATLKRSYDDES